MMYGRMPLFPPSCPQTDSVRVPLFDCPCAQNRCPPPAQNCWPPPAPQCQCVRLCNPCNPGEYADVELCVDAEGKLSICVRRPPCGCAPPKRRKPHCDCGLPCLR